MSLSDKEWDMSIYDTDDEKHMFLAKDVKESIKDIIAKGEVLKNGAFIINYKDFKQEIGEELCSEGEK